MIPASLPFRPSSPSTTTSRCTRRCLIRSSNDAKESEGVQVMTPGKSADLCFKASLILKSRDWNAPERTSVYGTRGNDAVSILGRESKQQGNGRTITSTVSYISTTIPSSSTIGTALMPRSLNIWTTSNTVVSRVAVHIGWNGLAELGDTYVPICSSRRGMCKCVISRHCESELMRFFSRIGAGRLTLMAMNFKTRY
jgi:hypothetical protein